MLETPTSRTVSSPAQEKQQRIVHAVPVGTLMKVTYRQIQASVKETAGFVPKTDWIAHVKELNGLPLKQTHKTRKKRLEPCPPDKRKAIEDALRRFGFLSSGRKSNAACGRETIGDDKNLIEAMKTSAGSSSRIDCLVGDWLYD